MRFGYFIFHSFFLSRYVEQLALSRAHANVDGLTGAFNARYFYARLKAEQKFALATDKFITLAFFDLDNFKRVNDEKGHAEGDEVLRCFTQIARQSIRTDDCFARLGGDEFVLLLPGAIMTKAQSILAQIKDHAHAEFTERQWAVSVSVGAVTTRRPGISTEKLIAAADKLMYDSKRAGKNRINHQEI